MTVDTDPSAPWRELYDQAIERLKREGALLAASESKLSAARARCSELGATMNVLQEKLATHNRSKSIDARSHEAELRENLAAALSLQAKAERKLSSVSRRLSVVEGRIADEIGFEGEGFDELVGRLLVFHHEDAKRIVDLGAQVSSLTAALELRAGVH